MTRRRLRLAIRGLVQGVGFRPHAYRTATALGLVGRVYNDGDGVIIEVEGDGVEAFEARLRATAPPLARIDSITPGELPLLGDTGFSISPSGSAEGVAVPADAALCERCLRELFDARDRRHHHPFIACCDCGPRYTMARRLPYDRRHTSMGDFALCAACAREYADPHSRRFHAEAIACHDCGPTLSLPVDRIAAALRDGAIVALKGLGGYHLLCDARSPPAIARLRQRKGRATRPLAVMLLNAASAGRQVELSGSARAALQSERRPIVIAERAATADLPAADLAPGLASLGVMLPYTAVHYLLFHALVDGPPGHGWLEQPAAPALVVTSANTSGEPILIDDEAARHALGAIADLLVTHTREITRACDDTVLRATPEHLLVVRRGRGCAPRAAAARPRGTPVLALGAHLKNTVCLLNATGAWLTPHIGDLDTPESHLRLARHARDLLARLPAPPQAIACDLHPDYASTRLARQIAEAAALPLVAVQHHHAHIAAVLAAHGHEGPALGLALDGHGLGSDGGSWGGELLRVDGARMARLGHLRPLPLPGGDRAARAPWRIAAAFAQQRGRVASLDDAIRRQHHFDAVLALGRSPRGAQTTAGGRYFDTAAALLGVCLESAYEAEAPMRLESQCRELRVDRGLYALADSVLDLHPLLERLLDISEPAQGAALFHGTLLDALVQWLRASADATGITTVALGGGCFLNAVLAAELPPRLARAGLRVLTAWERVTPADGGISLGQAWVAARHVEEGGEIMTRRDHGARETLSCA